MFAIAFLIGVYANIIFLLGLVGLYTPIVIAITTVCYLGFSAIFWKKFDERIEWRKIKKELGLFWSTRKIWTLVLLIVLGIIFIGVLSPELGFDALWYHLTLPKIFLNSHRILFLPGGLFYYSTMPKLGEMLYLSSLAMGTDTLAHSIHAFFAVLSAIAIYCITLRFTSKKYAFLAVAIFFSNIVVLWEATTAYIDLIRAFFEIMSVWGMLFYLSTKKQKWLIESALLLGLAVETKLIALGSVIVMIIVFWIFTQDRVRQKIQRTLLYTLLAITPSLGWLVFSYVQTGNPFYPLFSVYAIHLGKDTLAFPQVITDLVTIFLTASDPISPIYLVLLPLFFVVRRKLPKKSLPIFVAVLVSMIIWTLTPKTGGGRFLLAYLPVLSVASGIILSSLKGNTQIQRISIVVVFICLVIAALYRGVASLKYFPVVLGFESRQHFLATHLNFEFGDFYDINQEIKNTVKPGTKTLLYGFHNLYYMDIPFIDSSYVRPGDKFSYILTQHTSLPKRFSYWQPIYTNPTTGITLYTVGSPWMY
ncbi:MAG TPA: glycosyltransferase family 39 protein [Patescibacteria group bacterium]|nr:glycosyltransferase family 39 protein [Patescibacteria group bacterium]